MEPEQDHICSRARERTFVSDWLHLCPVILQEQALSALQTAAKEFERPAFPCALIAGLSSAPHRLQARATCCACRSAAVAFGHLTGSTRCSAHRRCGDPAPVAPPRPAAIQGRQEASSGGQNLLHSVATWSTLDYSAAERFFSRQPVCLRRASRLASTADRPSSGMPLQVIFIDTYHLFPEVRHIDALECVRA